MIKKEAVGIAVRLFAIFLGVYSLRFMSTMIPFAATSDSDSVTLNYVLILGAFPLLAAALLWRFPLTVATLLLPASTEQTEATALNANDMEVAGFSIVGLWVLASAIPDLFYWVTYAYAITHVDSGVGWLPDQIGGAVSTVIELGVGFWLLLGSGGLLKMISRIRGRSK
jgi:hypothetical protein